MDQVIRGLDFCYVYIDDMLIASHTPDKHNKVHLRLVLQHFDQYGILINPAKCVFGVNELHFLGYHVTSAGVSPLPQQVQSIRDFPHASQTARILGLSQLLSSIYSALCNHSTLCLS